jgi:DNA-directed RNA polymerases I, II, and III subunit RPABC2
MPEDDMDAQAEGAETANQHADQQAGAASQTKRTVVQGYDGTTGKPSKRIPDDKRTTTPYLTKYERARVIGSRATQIA